MCPCGRCCLLLLLLLECHGRCLCLPLGCGLLQLLDAVLAWQLRHPPPIAHQCIATRQRRRGEPLMCQCLLRCQALRGVVGQQPGQQRQDRWVGPQAGRLWSCGWVQCHALLPPCLCGCAPGLCQVPRQARGGPLGALDAYVVCVVRPVGQLLQCGPGGGGGVAQHLEHPVQLVALEGDAGALALRTLRETRSGHGGRAQRVVI
jgi:hypothetical protein